MNEEERRRDEGEREAGWLGQKGNACFFFLFTWVLKSDSIRGFQPFY